MNEIALVLFDRPVSWAELALGFGVRLCLASSVGVRVIATSRLQVRASTSPENTPAAAGAPPRTEAKEPLTASTVILSFSAFENTTKAPP